MSNIQCFVFVSFILTRGNNKWQNDIENQIKKLLKIWKPLKNFFKDWVSVIRVCNKLILLWQPRVSPYQIQYIYILYVYSVIWLWDNIPAHNIVLSLYRSFLYDIELNVMTRQKGKQSPKIIIGWRSCFSSNVYIYTQSIWEYDIFVLYIRTDIQYVQMNICIYLAACKYMSANGTRVWQINTICTVVTICACTYVCIAFRRRTRYQRYYSQLPHSHYQRSNSIKPSTHSSDISGVYIRETIYVTGSSNVACISLHFVMAIKWNFYSFVARNGICITALITIDERYFQQFFWFVTI